MVLGPSGGWSNWPLTGPPVKGGTGHLPSGLGVGKRWVFPPSLFWKERERRKHGVRRVGMAWYSWKPSLMAWSTESAPQEIMGDVIGYGALLLLR